MEKLVPIEWWSFFYKTYYLMGHPLKPTKIAPVVKESTARAKAYEIGAITLILPKNVYYEKPKEEIKYDTTMDPISPDFNISSWGGYL